MKLTVAANYDAELVPKLAEYPVDEVFGKFPADFVGGGRPTYMGTPVSHKQLTEYVSLLKKHGIAFNYLLNSACMANREWTKQWQKKLTSLLDKLERMQITRLTVSTPFLLEAIKARFPQFKVKVGLYAMVDSVKRAKYWESLGADSINLECRSINRDLNRLTAIRKAVRCDLQLIANHVCMPNCPMLGYHQNSIAHSSDGSKNIFIDYCFFRCSKLRLEDPSLFIKAGWIRPDDIPVYEQMGYDTFKILERGIPSSEILKRVKAYAERKFEGNLAEILLPYGFKEPIRKQRFWALRNFFKPMQVRVGYIGRFFKVAKGQGMMFSIKRNPFYIDSAHIPSDFIMGFLTRDCSMLDCAACGYCDTIARESVTVDSEFQKEFLKRYANIEKLMADGELWGV